MVHWVNRTHSLWVAISYFRASSQLRNWTWVSCRQIFTISATREGLKNKTGFNPSLLQWNPQEQHEASHGPKAGWSLAVIKICFEDSRPVAFTLEHTSASPGGLIQILAPGPRVSDSVCLGWGWRTCAGIKLPGETDAAGLGATPGEPQLSFAGVTAMWSLQHQERIKRPTRTAESFSLCFSQSFNLHEVSYRI